MRRRPGYGTVTKINQIQFILCIDVKTKLGTRERRPVQTVCRLNHVACVVSLRPSPFAEPTIPARTMYRLAILTISSSGARGEREDTGGQAIRDKLPPPDYEEARYEIVADDADTITGRISEWADSGEVDLIVSTGGTGMGRRDVTPEAARRAMDREVPGMAETMRAQTLKFTPMAMLSRSVVGIRGHTLIITLPGSPRGVGECLDVILPVLPHAIELLQRESVQEHPR